MTHKEDLVVARHIVAHREENIGVTLQATPTTIKEVDTAKGELLLTEKHARELLMLIMLDVTATKKIILALVTKDHRSPIRRTRWLE